MAKKTIDNYENFIKQQVKQFGPKQPSREGLTPEFEISSLILSSIAAFTWGKKVNNYKQIPALLGQTNKSIYAMVEDIKKSVSTEYNTKSVFKEIHNVLVDMLEQFKDFTINGNISQSITDTLEQLKSINSDNNKFFKDVQKTVEDILKLEQLRLVLDNDQNDIVVNNENIQKNIKDILDQLKIDSDYDKNVAISKGNMQQTVTDILEQLKNDLGYKENIATNIESIQKSIANDILGIMVGFDTNVSDILEQLKRNNTNKKIQKTQITNEEIKVKVIDGKLSDITGLIQLIELLGDSKLKDKLRVSVDALENNMDAFNSLIGFINGLKIDDNNVDKLGEFLQGLTSILSLDNIEDKLDDTEDNIKYLKELVNNHVLSLYNDIKSNFAKRDIKNVNNITNGINSFINNIDNLIDNMPGFKDLFLASTKSIILRNYADNINNTLIILNDVVVPKKLDKIFESYIKIIDSIVLVNERLKVINLKNIINASQSTMGTIKILKKIVKEIENLDEVTSTVITFNNLKATLKNFHKVFDVLKKTYDADLEKLNAAVGLVESFLVLLSSIDLETYKNENIKRIKEILENDAVDLLQSLSENSEFALFLESVVIVTDDDLKKFDAVIKVLEKLNKLSNIIKGGAIIEKGYAALEKAAEHISTIIDKLNKIKKEDLENAENSVKLIGKVVLMSGAILLFGGLLMTLINPVNLLVFAVTLGLFVGGIIGVFSLLKKDIETSFDAAESLMKLVLMSAFVLLFGGFIAQYINIAALFGFSLILGGFIFMIVGIYALFNKSIKSTFEGAENFGLLVVISAGILLFGSLIYQYIDFKNVLGFTVSLGIFMVMLSGVYLLFNLASKGIMKGTKEFLIILGVSAFILILGGYLYDVIEWKKTFLFGLGLGLFTLGIIGLWALASTFCHRALKGAKDFAILLGVSAFLMIFGPVLIEYIYGSWEEGWTKILGWGIMLALFVVGIGFAFKLMEKVAGKKAIATAAAFTLAVAISTAALLGGPYIMQEYGITSDMIGDFAVGLLVFTTLMCVVLGIAGNFLSQIALGAVAMALIGVLAIGAGYVIKLFYDAIKDIDIMKLIEGIGEMIILFGVVGAMAFGLGLLVMGPQAAIIEAGAAALAILEVLIAGASVCMTLIGKSIKVLDSVKDVDFTAVENVVVGFVKILGKLVDEMSLGMAIKLPLIMPSILLAGLALSMIGRTVQAWASMRVPTEFDDKGNPIAFKTMNPEDINAAGENIKNVLTAIGNAIVDTVDKNPEIFEGPLKGFGKSKFEIAIRGFAMAGDMLSNIATGIQDWAMLKVPTGFNKDGKPTGFILMKSTWLDKAAANIKNVLVCIGTAIVSVVQKNPELFEAPLLGLGTSPFETAVKAFTMAGDMLSNIAAGIQDWAMLKVPTGFTKDGKPTAYIPMKKEQLQDAANNIYNVLTAIGFAIVQTVKGNEEIFGGSGVLGLGKSPVEMAVKMFTQTGMMLSMIAMGIQAWAMLKVPTGFDKDGKPLGYTQMSLLDIQIAQLHIGFVLLGLGAAVANTVNNNPYIFSRGENSPGYIAAKSVKETTTALNNIVNVIKAFSNNEFKKVVNDMNTKGGTLDTIKGILGGIVDIINIFLNKAEGTDKGFWGTITGGKTVAEHLNDNKDEIEEAAESIKTFTGTVKSIFESVGKLCKDIKDDIPNLKIITEGTGIKTLKDGLSNLLDLASGTLQNYKDKIDFVNDNGEKFEIFKTFTELLDSFIISILKYDVTAQNNVKVLASDIISLYTEVQKIQNIINFKDYVNDIERFVESVNTLDISKLRQMNGLVQSMNELASKLGNIDKLTETLANEVTAVLLELVNQLRQAERVILNAHELQERRKKLIDESVDKVKKLMDKHMIVEIGRKEESEETPSTPAITNLPQPKSDNSATTSESNNMSDVASPETTESKGDAEKVKLGNNWGGQTLTVTEFTELMKKHMKTGRWT